LIQVFAPTFERLLVEHGPSVTFHGTIVTSEKLSSEHTLELVLRTNAVHCRHVGDALLIELLLRGLPTLPVPPSAMRFHLPPDGAL